MDKTWCIFYVSNYKGGELHINVNMNTEDMLNCLADDWDFLWDVRHKPLTDEELWEMWENWYNDEERHNLYAYDTRSEKQVYSIKDGKLVSDFPTNEEIIKYMKLAIKRWKLRN